MMPPSRDVEMATFGLKEDSGPRGSMMSMRGASAYSYYDDETPRSRPIRRWLDSFRRDPGRHITPAFAIQTPEDLNIASAPRLSDDLPHAEGVSARDSQSQDGHYFDLHAANVGTANTLLSRELKGRHLQMIAIGGSIGRRYFRDYGGRACCCTMLHHVGL
jgi:amino acid transporter